MSEERARVKRRFKLSRVLCAYFRSPIRPRALRGLSDAVQPFSRQSGPGSNVSWTSAVQTLTGWKYIIHLGLGVCVLWIRRRASLCRTEKVQSELGALRLRYSTIKNGR